MTTQPETLIVKKLQKWIKEQGGDSWKVHGSMMQRKGEPDLDGWLPSPYGCIHLKLEVKTPTGKPSAIQLVRLRKYHKAEYLVGVVTCVKGLDVLRSIHLEAIIRSLTGLPRSFKNLYIDHYGEDPYNIY